MSAELFNITAIQALGQQEMLLQAHRATAVPSAIILFAGMMLVIFLFGIAQKDVRTSETFWMLFFLVLVVGGILLTWILFSPNSVQALVEFVYPRA